MLRGGNKSPHSRRKGRVVPHTMTLQEHLQQRTKRKSVQKRNRKGSILSKSPVPASAVSASLSVLASVSARLASRNRAPFLAPLHPVRPVRPVLFSPRRAHTHRVNRTSRNADDDLLSTLASMSSLTVSKQPPRSFVQDRRFTRTQCEYCARKFVSVDECLEHPCDDSVGKDQYPYSTSLFP